MLNKKLNHLIRKHGEQAFFIAILAAVVSVIVLYSDQYNLWNEVLNPIIGLCTFLVAISFWYNGIVMNWENELPKKLTVRFVYNKRLVMICKNALLTHEGDIRMWGQQIGRQMNRNQNLSFQGFFEMYKSAPELDDFSEPFRPYILQIHLTKLPLEEDNNAQSKFAEGKYLKWMQRKAGVIDADWITHPDHFPNISENSFI